MARARVILALALTYMVFAVLLNSVGAVILQSIKSFGVAKPEAALLEGMKDLPIAAVSLIAGGFVPQLGYRRGMAAVLLAVGAACLAMPLVGAFWMTKLLFLTIGCSFAVVKISVYSTIGLVSEDPKAHAGLTSLIEGLFMVGVLGGAWLFSAFIDPANPASPAWLNVYWVLAAGAAAAALLWAVSPVNERRAERAGESVADKVLAMPKLLLVRFVPLFLLCAFLYVLIEQSLGTWLPTFNHEVLRLSPAMSVQAGSLFAAALALGRLGGAFALRRQPWIVVLMACVAGMAAVVLIALPLARGVHAPPATWAEASLAAWLLPLVGVFMGPIYPAVNSAVLSALPPDRQPSMTGLIVVFSALGGTLGSFITGRAFGWLPGGAVFYLTLAPLALLGLALLMFRRSLEAAGGPMEIKGPVVEPEPLRAVG